MALDKSKLSSSLRSLFENPDGISSAADAEAKWADAYNSYAMDAEDASGDRPAVTNQGGFLSTLSLVEGATVAGAAQLFDAAFVTYWTGGVFVVGTPITVPPPGCPSIGGTTIWATEITSLVTVVVPGVLAGLLAPILGSLSDSATPASKANGIAGAFHQATTTAVMVLMTGLDTTPPPVGPLPVTNLCTIR